MLYHYVLTHSNSTRQNNTCHVHVERNENNREESLSSINHVEDGSREVDRGRENTWVKNLSSIPLTKDQIKALVHGPNYAIVPRSPPVGEYIVAIENACKPTPTGEGGRVAGRDKSSAEEDSPPLSSILQGKKERQLKSQEETRPE